MTAPVLTLDGEPATVQEYTDRVERASARVLEGAYHRPVARTMPGGAMQVVEEDAGVAAALVTTLAGVVAGGGATWAWVMSTLEAQRAAQLGAAPMEFDANPGSRRTDEEHLP